MQDYDEATAFLGEWGPFQRRIFFFLCVTIIPNGYVTLSMVFLADTPQHHCHLPDSLNGTTGEANLSSLLPVEEVDGEMIYSRCRRYKTPVTDDLNDTTRETEPCVDGWEYSTDRYGRKVVLFGGIAMQTIFSFIQVACTSWEMFCVLSFFIGIGDISNYIAAFVLGTEVLIKSARIVYSTIGVGIFYAIGYICLSLFAYLIPDWKMLLLALTVPEILVLPFWWFIPESPRWLLSQGQVEEVEAIVKAAAKQNDIKCTGMRFENNDGATHGNLATRHTDMHNYLDLIRTNNIRNITVISFLLWMIITIGYYGLSFNMANLHGDPYINCFISAATEIVVYVMCWWFMHTTPRRIVTASMLFLSGSVLLLVQCVPKTLRIMTIIFVMIGKSGVTAAFTIIYIYSAELYPTVVRNMGLGACSMASRIGSMIAPYFAYLVMYDEVLPFMLMGTLMLTAGMFSLMLPETRDHPLPEMIQQTQSINCCWFSARLSGLRPSTIQTTVLQNSNIFSPASTAELQPIAPASTLAYDCTELP
ncbi:solute carrier family 22 member 5 isoform X3 [Callorhinchus milii]|uniref:solute carrier family 22 member 5 isoform X3 n=1 Tax=Callorhinchus milii TaxID=7868 RepID=UPI0004575C1C|nr:solute carrier family 22 member 5 isoform X3 [Callorhinchus milii]|eukprot:gi/632976929/ref/XP_007905064.1/ PREDICTED: solute carrier family 22 member 5-like isoform X2 [Callorhinchus milii]